MVTLKDVAKVFVLLILTPMGTVVLSEETMTTYSHLIDILLPEITTQNNWQHALFCIDKDFLPRPIMRSMSSLLVSSLVLLVKPNTTSSSRTILSSMVKNIIVQCESECLRTVISLASSYGLFTKQYTWVFLLNKQEVNELIKLLKLYEGFSTSSNIFIIHETERKSTVLRVVLTGCTSGYTVKTWTHVDLRLRRENKKSQLSFPLHGCNFTIGTLHVPPSVTIDESGSNPIFSGWNVEVLQLLSQYLGFRYNLVIERTGFGSLQNGTWTGLVGGILRKDYDIGGFPLGITRERSSVGDFATNILGDQFVAVMRTPSEDSDISCFSAYTAPFSTHLWLMCVCVCLLTYACFSFTIYFLPWCFKAKDTGSPPKGTSVIWSLISAILQTDIPELPERRSARTTIITFMFFTLFVFKTYNSLLTATLTIKTVPHVYDNLDELIIDGKYGIAIDESTSAIEDLKSAKSGPHHRVWRKILSKSGSIVSDRKEGYSKMMKEDYVFIDLEADAVHQVSQSKCRMIILKQRYLPISLSFFFPKNSSLVDTFSLKILTLRSSGILKRLHNQGLTKQEGCVTNRHMEIPLQHTAGAFVLLLGGILVSMSCLLAEILNITVSNLINK